VKLVNKTNLDIVRSFDTNNDYYNYIFAYHDESAWKEATSIVTLAARQKYLETFPDGAHVRECEQDVGEIVCWQNAIAQDSIEGFQSYIRMYPSGYFAQECKECLQELEQDESDWLAADSNGAVSDYESYLQRHPNGKQRKQAQAAIQRLEQDRADWENANNQMSIEAFERYLAKFPEGQFVDQAADYLSSLKADLEAWRRACEVATENGYKHYLSGPTPRLYDTDAKLRIEDLQHWERVRRVNDLNAYNDYLQSFNSPLFEAEARAAIEELESLEQAEKEFWLACAQSKDVGECRKYLERWPEGRFVEDCKNTIHRLEHDAQWQRAMDERSIQGFELYLNSEKPLFYEKEANDRIKEIKDWEFVTAQHKLVTYRKYISSYEDPLFEVEAQGFIDDLKKAEEKKRREAEEKAKREDQERRKKEAEKLEEQKRREEERRKQEEEQKRRQLEEDAWAKVSSEDVRSGYKAFLENFPDGENSPGANKKIREIDSRIIIEKCTGERVFFWRNNINAEYDYLTDLSRSGVYFRESAPKSYFDRFVFNVRNSGSVEWVSAFLASIVVFPFILLFGYFISDTAAGNLLNFNVVVFLSFLAGFSFMLFDREVEVVGPFGYRKFKDGMDSPIAEKNLDRDGSTEAWWQSEEFNSALILSSSDDGKKIAIESIESAVAVANYFQNKDVLDFSSTEKWSSFFSSLFADNKKDNKSSYKKGVRAKKTIKVPSLDGFKDIPVIEIIEVNVVEGDTVSQEDPMVVLESDKETVEILSPYAGKIGKVLVKEGDKRCKGDDLLEIIVRKD